MRNRGTLRGTKAPCEEPGYLVGAGISSKVSLGRQNPREVAGILARIWTARGKDAGPLAGVPAPWEGRQAFRRLSIYDASCYKLTDTYDHRGVDHIVIAATESCIEI